MFKQNKIKEENFLLKFRTVFVLFLLEKTLEGIRGKTVRQVEQELRKIITLLKYFTDEKELKESKK